MYMADESGSMTDEMEAVEKTAECKKSGSMTAEIEAVEKTAECNFLKR